MHFRLVYSAGHIKRDGGKCGVTCLILRQSVGNIIEFRAAHSQAEPKFRKKCEGTFSAEKLERMQTKAFLVRLFGFALFAFLFLRKSIMKFDSRIDLFD